MKRLEVGKDMNASQSNDYYPMILIWDLRYYFVDNVVDGFLLI